MQSRIIQCLLWDDWWFEIIQTHFTFQLDSNSCPFIPNDAITNYPAFLSQEKRDPRLAWRLQRLQRSLAKVYSNNPDPIAYILELYYQWWLWIEDVNKRLKELDSKCWNTGKNRVSYSSDSSIRNLLTVSLWCEMRNIQDRTEIQRRKISNPKSSPILAMQRHWKDRLSLAHNDFTERTKKLLESSFDVSRKFDKTHFDSLRWNGRKTFYLLETCNNISKQDLYKIFIWLKLQWVTSIRKIINLELEKIHLQNPEIPLIQISDWTLSKEFERWKQLYGVTE